MNIIEFRQIISLLPSLTGEVGSILERALKVNWYTDGYSKDSSTVEQITLKALLTILQLLRCLVIQPWLAVQFAGLTWCWRWAGRGRRGRWRGWPGPAPPGLTWHRSNCLRPRAGRSFCYIAPCLSMWGELLTFVKSLVSIKVVACNQAKTWLPCSCEANITS